MLLLYHQFYPSSSSIWSFFVKWLNWTEDWCIETLSNLQNLLISTEVFHLIHFQSIIWHFETFDMILWNRIPHQSSVIFDYSVSIFYPWHPLKHPLFYGIMVTIKIHLSRSILLLRGETHAIRFKFWPHIWPFTVPDYAENTDSSA